MPCLTVIEENIKKEIERKDERINKPYKLLKKSSTFSLPFFLFSICADRQGYSAAQAHLTLKTSVANLIQFSYVWEVGVGYSCL